MLLSATLMAFLSFRLRRALSFFCFSAHDTVVAVRATMTTAMPIMSVQNSKDSVQAWKDGALTSRITTPFKETGERWFFLFFLLICYSFLTENCRRLSVCVGERGTRLEKLRREHFRFSMIHLDLSQNSSLFLLPIRYCTFPLSLATNHVFIRLAINRSMYPSTELFIIHLVIKILSIRPFIYPSAAPLHCN